MFQHTAARRRLVAVERKKAAVLMVSTHSRPKAAGSRLPHFADSPTCFNTQPPEGGWIAWRILDAQYFGFNTQPPEGGWASFDFGSPIIACFNTQPPEGGWNDLLVNAYDPSRCFNTQPPEGGWPLPSP